MRLLLAAAGLALALPAQERKPLLGRVLDASGAPVAGAEVVLGGVMARQHPGLADPDLIRTTTDARGRFRANLMAHVGYAAWALGPVVEGGPRPCSDLAQDVVAGPPLELRLQPGTSVALRIDGLEPWREAGPFRVLVAPADAPGTDTELVPAADGSFTVTDLPSGRLSVTLLDARSAILQYWLATADSDSQSLDLHPPQEVPLLVTDEQGAPVAGALVSLRVQRLWNRGTDRFGGWTTSLWRQVAVTDAEGRATARIPLKNGPFQDGRTNDCVLVASKDGLADSHSGWMNQYFEDGLRDGAKDPNAAGEEKPNKETESAARTEVKFVLRAEQALRGRILTGSIPVHGARVWVTWTDKVRHNPRGNAWTHLDRTALVTSDAEGRFAVPGLRADAYDFTAAVLDQGRLVVVDRNSGRAEDNWTFDLGTLHRLSFQILDATHGPAQGAAGLLVHLDSSQPSAENALRFFADAAGRGEVQLLRGRWLAIVTDGRSFTHQEIAVHDDKSVVQLAMAPFPVLRGRVLDENGEPVAGASVLAGGSRARGNRDPTERIIDSLSSQLNQRLLREVRSDAEGRFEIPFLPRDHITQRLRLQDGSRRSEEFVLEVMDGPIELRLVGQD